MIPAEVRLGREYAVGRQVRNHDVGIRDDRSLRVLHHARDGAGYDSLRCRERCAENQSREGQRQIDPASKTDFITFSLVPLRAPDTRMSWMFGVKQNFLTETRYGNKRGNSDSITLQT